MLDPQTQAVLVDVVRRQSCSLLQYVNEAFPWVAAGEQTELATVRGLAREEQAAAAELAKFLRRQRVGVPYSGSYPSAFTTINYVSLDYLLPLLLKHERQALAALEKATLDVHDPDARLVLDRLLETKRRHVKTLEALAATAHPGTAVH